jgi:polyisoprenyl-phosphate glycosyltransferase
VVAPFYNESAHVAPFLERLTAALAGIDLAWTVVCVNDGSSDDTLDLLLAAREREPRIKVVDLSRNFGKDYALTAGLDHCRSDAVVLMNSDLQHPPEFLPAMIAKWREGYEDVYMVPQTSGQAGLRERLGRSFLRRFARELRLPAEGGDFRLLGAPVVAAIRLMPERARFMRGIYHWVGFPQLALPYAAPLGRRRRRGLLRAAALAVEALSAFSNLPLRLWGTVGAAIAALSLLYGLARIVRHFIHGIDVPGYESIIVAVLFLGGVQLLTMGILAGYIGRIFNEVKHRPLYIVRQTYGLERRG